MVHELIIVLYFLAGFRAFEDKNKNVKLNWEYLFKNRRKGKKSNKTSIVKKIKVSKQLLKAASESYKHMIDNSKSRDILIIE